MNLRNCDCLARLGVTVVVLGGVMQCLAAEDGPKLRYDFQKGKDYAYDVKITAVLGDVEETHEGVLVYNVLSTTDQQIVFKQTGRLATKTKARPVEPGQSPRSSGRVPFPPFPRGIGGPRFAPGGPEGITIDRQGHRVLSRELTHLPFLLGDQEMLMIEDLPADGRPNWAVQGGVLVEEKGPSRPFGPPTGPTTSEREGIVRSEYGLLDKTADACRISKKFLLRTGPESGVKARFEMTGDGELTFDAKQGAFASASMKYTIRVSDEQITLTIPVTVAYRLLTSEELAKHQKDEEEAKVKAEEARVKAATPVPFKPGELADLLRDLHSKDTHVQTTAADRLQKAPVDEHALEIAKALAPLANSSDRWVQGAAVKALVVWAAPEAEAALVQASQSENVFVRGPAIEALGKIKSAAAAAAVAAQMYRNRGEAAKALKQMGPIAEAATIGCLKERDGWVRNETVKVLAEIGGEESVKALNAYSEHLTGFDLKDAAAAISAIEKRLAASPPAPAKSAKTAKAAEPEFRTWRDASGTFEVEASLVTYQDQTVTLKRKDGRTVQVPVDKLSKEDRDYLTKLPPKPANPFD